MEDNRALLLLRLWALAIGAATALNEHELNWYTIRIRPVMNNLELSMPHEVEHELGKYIWTPVNNATFIKDTWPDIEKATTPADTE